MLILYSPHTSPRLQYMANWLGQRLFGKPLEIVSSKDAFGPEHVLNYSAEAVAGTYQIVPTGLLQETGIRQQATEITPGELPHFFATAGMHPFDMLSAAFYLLSRYEEWLPHQKDMYGRYAHENSLAFQNGFLKRPLADEWVNDLKLRLQAFFPELVFAEKSFSFVPTYDVDMAWSYRGKSFSRQLGGTIKQALKGEWTALEERRKVANGFAKDPFDVFEDLDELHMRYDLKPYYFYLLAQKVKGYDKNIPPGNIPFQNLVNELSESYKTGIHLSWQAWDDAVIMQKEKTKLEQIIGRKVTANRMHYIKFEMPDTFRKLIALGITEDYSMGYGSINGFRASTATPYYWYDLEAETSTDLLLFPFCYMEANSIFEQKDDPETALAEMLDYWQIIQKTGGVFISIFHNHLIGRDVQGRKWWEMYEQFLSQMSFNLP